MGRGWKRTDVKSSAPRQSFTRHCKSGFLEERENLTDDAKGKDASGWTREVEIPMRRSGADRAVGAMKRGNAR